MLRFFVFAHFSLLTVNPLPLDSFEYEKNLNTGMNPEELGDFWEGDVVVSLSTRNGILDGSFRWENGVVPFTIDNTHSEHSRKQIISAMEEYHKNTCIRFHPKTANDTDYIEITNKNSGCWSNVGRQGGRQPVNLQGNLCLQKQIGTAIHELMHALGFTHEQNRYERDDFITVVNENIKSGAENNFRKVEKGTFSGFGQPYDYDSVMHYSSKAFSKNGEATIIPKKSNAKIGQRKGFSVADLAKVNAMYNCTKIGYQDGEKTLSEIVGKGGGGEGTLWGTIAHAIGLGEAETSV